MVEEELAFDIKQHHFAFDQHLPYNAKDYTCQLNNKSENRQKNKFNSAEWSHKKIINITAVAITLIVLIIGKR